MLKIEEKSLIQFITELDEFEIIIFNITTCDAIYSLH